MTPTATDLCVICRDRAVDPESPDGWCRQCWQARIDSLAPPMDKYFGRGSERNGHAPGRAPRANDDRHLAAESFLGIKAEPTRWLWDGRIPLGTATLLVGREKLGKSTLSVELAASLSRGDLQGHLHGQPAASLSSPMRTARRGRSSRG
jgi:hypothetical protein